MANSVDFISASRPFERSFHYHGYDRARMRQQQFDGSSGVPTRQAAATATLTYTQPDTKLAGLTVQHIEGYSLSSGGRTRHRSPDTRLQQRSAPRYVEPSSSLSSNTSLSSLVIRAEQDDARKQQDAALEDSPIAQKPQHNPQALTCSSPVQIRHGRKYIRNEAYPLPCDLQELHRQNLKTMLTCSVLGRAVCSPRALSRPPLRVLEVGCGTAFWTMQCHQMFSAMGHDDIMYTGLDVVALAPDLRRRGLNWTFLQHEMRSMPWPLDDESFDLIMCKDMSIAIPLGVPTQRIMDECIRLLSVGGTLEIWESDHTIRSLQPHRPAMRVDDFEQKIVNQTATYPMSPLTPFVPTTNRYLKAANTWIEQAMNDRNLSSTPCSRVAPMLLQEPGSLAEVGFRRIAIPLSSMDWDSERCFYHDVERKARSQSRAPRAKKALDAEQIALRETALLVVIQMIESLEPLLKKASGKNTEEWSYWWACMMNSLTNNTSTKAPLNGECLELGAWWAVKVDAGGPA